MVFPTIRNDEGLQEIFWGDDREKSGEKSFLELKEARIGVIGGARFLCDLPDGEVVPILLGRNSSGKEQSS